MEALLQNARHMVAFFEKHTSLQFVSRQLDRRHSRRHTGSRHGHPFRRTETGELARKLGPDVAALLRRQLYDAIIPRHGHHGRPRPAGIPAHHDVGRSPSSTPPGGSRSTCST